MIFCVGSGLCPDVIDVHAQSRPKRCSPRAGSLIVLNFSAEPVRIFVNNRPIGRVPRLDQKRFQRVLRVGENSVSAIGRTQGMVLGTQAFSVEDLGSRTCSQSRVLTIGSIDRPASIGG
jgi:hypothetical protein